MTEGQKNAEHIYIYIVPMYIVQTQTKRTFNCLVSE